MKQIHILYGFDNPEFEGIVKNLLRSKGFDVKSATKLSKPSVKEYLESNSDCNTVVLKEAFSKEVYYSAEEIAQLTDMRDINVIVVLSERHKGTSYMGVLYAAGVTNAIFQKGRNGGATPGEIASMIIQRRSRAEAREYYQIAANKIDLGFLDTATYAELYRELRQGDGSLLENYLNVCSRLSPQQIAGFTKRLPKEDLEELSQYEEFHSVVQLLKKFGVKLKVRKPKSVRVGLTTPVQIGVTEDKITFSGIQKKEEKLETEQAEVGKEEYEMEEKGNDLESMFAGMSLADLFSASESDVVQNEDEGKEMESAGSGFQFFGAPDDVSVSDSNDVSNKASVEGITREEISMETGMSIEETFAEGYITEAIGGYETEGDGIYDSRSRSKGVELAKRPVFEPYHYRSQRDDENEDARNHDKVIGFKDYEKEKALQQKAEQEKALREASVKEKKKVSGDSVVCDAVEAKAVNVGKELAMAGADAVSMAGGATMPNKVSESKKKSKDSGSHIIEFDDYEPGYDEYSIDSGVGFLGKPFIAALAIMVGLLVGVLFYASQTGTSLF